MRFGQPGLLTAAAAAALLTVLPAATAQAAAPSQFDTYYSIFDTGEQRIPYLDTTSYVPQGLAYWPEDDAMIVSYYDDGDGKARIAIVDRTTSAHKKTLVLDDVGHAGALTMSAHFLWVASSGKVIRYAKSALAAPANSEITRDKTYTLRASSFMEIFGDKMYVGTFNPTGGGMAYRYALDANEEPQDDNHSFGVPKQTQGMAITADHFVWSCSYGHNEDSRLVVDPRDGAITRTVIAPNMSEDLATVGGEIYVVYESAAKKYADADYKIRSIHHGKLSALIP